MIISAIKSKDVSDKRSVLHPETIKNLISKGIEIIFESGIGDGIHVDDQTFIDLGAKSVSRERLMLDLFFLTMRKVINIVKKKTPNTRGLFLVY